METSESPQPPPVADFCQKRHRLLVRVGRRHFRVPSRSAVVSADPAGSVGLAQTMERSRAFSTSWPESLDDLAFQLAAVHRAPARTGFTMALRTGILFDGERWERRPASRNKDFGTCSPVEIYSEVRV